MGPSVETVQLKSVKKNSNEDVLINSKSKEAINKQNIDLKPVLKESAMVKSQSKEGVKKHQEIKSNEEIKGKPSENKIRNEKAPETTTKASQEIQPETNKKQLEKSNSKEGIKSIETPVMKPTTRKHLS